VRDHDLHQDTSAGRKFSLEKKEWFSMHPVSRGHQVTPQEQIAAIAGMQVEIRHLITSIESLSDDVRELKTQLDRGRGVWATLVCVGAVTATLISAGAWAFEHFMKGVVR
jgi:hypothetical protein